MKPTSMKPTSLVTLLLDRSYSMLVVKEATIEAYNGYVAGLQQEQDAEIDFTSLQFDTQSLDKVCVAIPVNKAQMLTEASYVPRGGTPLIDAAVKTINAVDASLSKRLDKPKVVICIQTDGEENSSVEHTWEELQGLVKQKEAEGWQFNFLGAGIDAYVQGAKMGIAAASTMSYNIADPIATRYAFAASASNAADFVAGRATTTAYTENQRRSSGDAYVPSNLTESMNYIDLVPSGDAVSPSDLDLTASGYATLQTGLTDTPKRRRQGPVADIEL